MYGVLHVECVVRNNNGAWRWLEKGLRYNGHKMSQPGNFATLRLPVRYEKCNVAHLLRFDTWFLSRQRLGNFLNVLRQEGVPV